MKFTRIIVYVFIQFIFIAVTFADTVKYKLVATSSENFAKPHDIVLSPDNNLLYVADNGNDRVVILNPNTLEILGEFANDEVLAPHDLDFDAQGHLLVADTDNDRIAIYAVHELTGKLVGSIQHRIRRPEGIAVHPDGRVFATGAASNNLVVYIDGEVIAETGGLSSPHDVAFDPEGGIWVADAGNDRIIRYNDNLEITKILTGLPYDFDGPRYMDFDSDARLYVADKYNNRIKIIEKNGQLIHVLGSNKKGKGEGMFNRPEGVEILLNDIWFSDTYNNRIVRYHIINLDEQSE